jgi:hypothetical protein
MTGNLTDGVQRAVANLMQGCAAAHSGARVLLLEEDAHLGHYGRGLGLAISEAAVEQGFAVSRHDIGFSAQPGTLPPDTLAAMDQADHIIYLARLGDQMRFRPLPYAERSIVNYAVTLPALAGPFGTIPHAAMLALKIAINASMQAAREIRVTCPLGTDLLGRMTGTVADLADVGIRRFPMCVFAPIPMQGFAGRIALARFLVGTGSIYYEPFVHAFDGVVMVRVKETRIIGYDGPPDAVDGIRTHVAKLAKQYGLDGDFVHSWHAGIHPGCAYEGRALDNPGRWTGSAFGNPRLLHLHTCGAYAPGEICWNLLDPTIMLDGVALWQAGRLHPECIPGGSAVLESCPELAAAFARPANAVGLD